MEKIKKYKILILITIFILNILFVDKIYATSITLNPSKDTLGLGEQFYVDVIFNPSEQSINTVSGKIIFQDKNVNFLRAEDGRSILNMWVERPFVSEKGVISFSGLTTNGFDGVIDPFSPLHKLPGLIIRLVFETKRPGQINFMTSDFVLYLNDGLGTELKIPLITESVIIDNYINRHKYESYTFETPELNAYVTRDENIYNNKYILIFSAIDKETGIKNVLIKEGKRDWTEAKSPYLLKDQSRHSLITLQAVSFSGAGVIINIDKIPYDWGFITKEIVVVLLIVVFIIFMIKKRYVSKKRK